MTITNPRAKEFQAKARAILTAEVIKAAVQEIQTEDGSTTVFTPGWVENKGFMFMFSMSYSQFIAHVQLQVQGPDGSTWAFNQEDCYGKRLPGLTDMVLLAGEAWRNGEFKPAPAPASKCSRCGGTGIIKQFKHHYKGVCFKCNGTSK